MSFSRSLICVSVLVLFAVLLGTQKCAGAEGGKHDVYLETYDPDGNAKHSRHALDPRSVYSLGYDSTGKWRFDKLNVVLPFNTRKASLKLTPTAGTGSTTVNFIPAKRFGRVKALMKKCTFCLLPQTENQDIELSEIGMSSIIVSKDAKMSLKANRGSVRFQTKKGNVAIIRLGSPRRFQMKLNFLKEQGMRPLSGSIRVDTVKTEIPRAYKVVFEQERPVLEEQSGTWRWRVRELLFEERRDKGLAVVANTLKDGLITGFAIDQLTVPPHPDTLAVIINDDDVTFNVVRSGFFKRKAQFISTDEYILYADLPSFADVVGEPEQLKPEPQEELWTQDHQPMGSPIFGVMFPPSSTSP